MITTAKALVEDNLCISSLRNIFLSLSNEPITAAKSDISEINSLVEDIILFLLASEFIRFFIAACSSIDNGFLLKLLSI